MRIILSRLAIVSVVVALAWYFVGTSDKERTISVSTSESISIEPDTAYLSVGVIAYGETTEEALRKVENTVTPYLDYLAVENIPEAAIKALDVKLEPRREWDKDLKRHKMNGFMASREIEVKVKDFPAAGRHLSKASEFGFNKIKPIRPDIEDMSALEERVVALAAKKARSLAEAAGKGGGFKVGSVISVQVNRMHVPHPIGAEARIMGAAPVVSSKSMKVSPGEMRVSASLSVVFGIK